MRKGQVDRHDHGSALWNDSAWGARMGCVKAKESTYRTSSRTAGLVLERQKKLRRGLMMRGKEKDGKKVPRTKIELILSFLRFCPTSLDRVWRLFGSSI
jgi:hypothetical protein